MLSDSVAEPMSILRMQTGYCVHVSCGSVKADFFANSSMRKVHSVDLSWNVGAFGFR